MPSIADVLGGGLLDGVSKIISQFKGSPEDKAKLQELVEQNAAQFKIAEMDANVKLNDIAGQNIRAEAQSASWLAKNCRPFFLFAGACLMVFNYSIPTIVSIFNHPITPVALPDLFYKIYAAGYLGYVVGRSTEKSLNADN